MGIFSSIKDAIFGKKAVAAPPAAAPNPVGTALDAARAQGRPQPPPRWRGRAAT